MERSYFTGKTDPNSKHFTVEDGTFLYKAKKWLMYNRKCIACNEMLFYLSSKYIYCVLKIVISSPAQRNFYIKLICDCRE